MDRKKSSTALLVILLAIAFSNLIPPTPVQAYSGSDLLGAIQALRQSSGIPLLIVDSS